MSLTKDYKTKLRMAFDRQLPAEARAFAPTIMVKDVAAQHLGAIVGLFFASHEFIGATHVLKSDAGPALLDVGPS